MKKNSYVLVVDDSRDMLDLQKMILENDGFRVVTAQSGIAALDVISNEDEPSLIILDQEMEDMTGTEFLEILHEKNPNIGETVPVVILSGSEPPSTSMAVGYIQKFPDIEVFLERIHHFIRSGVRLHPG